jgi:hypothetical protein
MDDTEIKERAEEEQDRITDILKSAGVSDKRMRTLEPVILNTAWMKAKLDDAREAIKNSNIVISYDNGGGQKGLRENPLFKGYESLFKSYMSGMKQILDILPKQAEEVKSEELEKPQTMLELVRNKHRKEA